MNNSIVIESIKLRIFNEHVKAQRVISRFVKRKEERLRYEFFRKIGLFDATLYLENQCFTDPNSNMYLTPQSKVFIIGEFSPQDGWNLQIPCVYDSKFACFKAQVFISICQQFKFFVEDSMNQEKSYFISERYPFCLDECGNTNNVFIPKLIRKKKKGAYQADKNDSQNIIQPTFERNMNNPI